MTDGLPETTVSQDSTDSDNPFACGAFDHGQSELSVAQFASAILVGIMTALLAAAVGVFCWWNGTILFLKFYSDHNPQAPFFDQVSVVELIAGAMVLLAVLLFSGWLGLNARNNLHQQLLRNSEAKAKRAILEAQVTEMHRIVKLQAEESREKR